MTIALIAAIVLILGFVFVQNRLVRAQNAVQSAYSGIQVQLKRRHDLVPALIDTVRSAIAQEEKLFQHILEVREKAVEAVRKGAMDAIKTAEEELTSSLRQFFGYAEDHPQITSTGNISKLQAQLEETEDQISAARRLYNGNVAYFNTMLDAIPSNWVGSMLRMKRAEFFTLGEDEAKQVETMPRINLPGAQA
ncbi:MAG: LemA family protein [Rhizobiaceae bacterium]|nr:LemA family protein [Rhizobiaceae bacterium]